VATSGTPGTLVDTNVLFDFLSEDADWFDWAAAMLRDAGDRGPVTINPIIYAEVSVRYARIEEVELALTPDQRAQGLMHRESMPLDQGMLFDFGETRPVSMWMQNTPLPLDMLFIQRDGTISHIHKRAVPFSEAIIDSRGPVNFVLELNGNRADVLGISVGDRVLNKRIQESK